MKTFRTGGDSAAAAGGDGVSTGETVAKRFRYLATVQKGRLPINGNSDAVDADMVPYLTMEYLRNEIADPPLISNDPRAVVANDGDLLLLWDGSNAGEFLRAKSGIVSSTAALVTSRGVDREYLYWACKALEDRVRSETVGMGIPHVNGEYLANLRVPTPHEQRQRAIADYLDRETARIDALIAAKERVLALLAEKRRALITRAVTKGLDPTVPMKDSGIPWLGKIPAHWQLKKLALLASLKSGESITADDIKDEGRYAVYGGNGLRGYTDRFTHEGEYVLIGRQGALCGNINYAKGRFFPSEHAVVVTPREKLAVRWIGELLRVMDLNQYSASAAQPGLAVEAIATLRVPVPPFDEQLAITEHITCQTATLDALRAATERTIALLKERRSALIAAAVTGQIDVPACAVGTADREAVA